MRLTNLSVVDVAKVLSAASGLAISSAIVQADLDAGAPRNDDGTVNLILYGAWLCANRHGESTETPTG